MVDMKEDWICKMSEPVIFKSPYGDLEGDFYEGPNKKCIIHCHGFCSNKDRERMIRASELYNKKGFGVLRFNFGGSGKSYDIGISVERQVWDLKAAIEFVKKKGYKEIGLQGESLGGLICLRVYPFYKDIIKSIVLWAPVTRSRSRKRYIYNHGWNESSLLDRGYISHKHDRKIFRIPLKFFIEIEAIDRGLLLGEVKCPVLILHGAEDNMIPLDVSEKAAEFLEKGRLEVIQGVGHKFDDNQEVLDLSLNWFEKNLG